MRGIPVVPINGKTTPSSVVGPWLIVRAAHHISQVRMRLPTVRYSAVVVRPHRCKRSATSAGELSLVRCPPFVDFENPTAAVRRHEERPPRFHASAGLVPGAQLCVASIDTVASYEPPCGFLFRSRRRGHGIAAGRMVAVSLASRPAASCKAPGG